MCQQPGCARSLQCNKVPWDLSVAGHPESIRKWEQFPPGTGTIRISSGKTRRSIKGAPEVPALFSPLSLPQSAELLALHRSVSSIVIKTCMEGSCCTRENLRAFTCANQNFQTLAHQSYRWHACLTLWFHCPWLWVESSIYANIACILYKFIIQNTMYFLWVLKWEILA